MTNFVPDIINKMAEYSNLLSFKPMKQTHVIWKQERIAQKDVVIEEVSNMPAESDAFQTKDLVIVINLGGHATFKYDMKPCVTQHHQVGVILPFHIFSDAQWSEDYKALVIVVSNNLYSELILRDSFKDYIKYGNRPAHTLTEEQYEKISNIVHTMRIISESEHPKRHEMLTNLIDIIFYALTRYRNEETPIPTSGRNEQLFNRFYDLIITSYTQHHEIGWYAEQLCLTPKYFSSVIRKNTNKSAAEWINIVLITYAKKLLLTRRDLTVQQVAYELGFSENASFCRFFKAQTGMRPKEYREGKEESSKCRL